ncbi:MAG: hypothetical protein ACOYK8_03205 [Alphaproteobacteria bacterium]
MQIDLVSDIFLSLMAMMMMIASFVAYFRTRWFLANANRTQATITNIEKDEKQEETTYTLEFKDQFGKEWQVRTQSGTAAATIAKKFNREKRDAFVKQNERLIKDKGCAGLKEKIDTLLNQELIGECIFIFYQQDKPEKIRVDHFGSLWLGSLLEGAAGLILVSYLVFQHWNKIIQFL